jgi:hypothetical protein
MEGKNDGKCKYGWEWYDGSLREFLVENPSPRKTTY